MVHIDCTHFRSACPHSARSAEVTFSLGSAVGAVAIGQTPAHTAAESDASDADTLKRSGGKTSGSVGVSSRWL